MIKLFHKETGAALGTITEAQLEFLIAQLEEESLTDQDYYLNQDTIGMFEEMGADPELLTVLRSALGTQEDMEIVWQRE